jgi:hypothetical protein
VGCLLPNLFHHRRRASGLGAVDGSCLGPAAPCPPAPWWRAVCAMARPGGTPSPPAHPPCLAAAAALL